MRDHPPESVRLRLDVAAEVAIGIAVAGHRSLLSLSWPIVVESEAGELRVVGPGELRELVRLMQR